MVESRNVETGDTKEAETGHIEEGHNRGDTAANSKDLDLPFRDDISSITSSSSSSDHSGSTSTSVFSFRLVDAQNMHHMFPSICKPPLVTLPATTGSAVDAREPPPAHDSREKVILNQQPAAEGIKSNRRPLGPLCGNQQRKPSCTSTGARMKMDAIKCTSNKDTTYFAAERAVCLSSHSRKRDRPYGITSTQDEKRRKPSNGQFKQPSVLYALASSAPPPHSLAQQQREQCDKGVQSFTLPHEVYLQDKKHKGGSRAHTAAAAGEEENMFAGFCEGAAAIRTTVFESSSPPATSATNIPLLSSSAGATTQSSFTFTSVPTNEPWCELNVDTAADMPAEGDPPHNQQQATRPFSSSESESGHCANHHQSTAKRNRAHTHVGAASGRDARADIINTSIGDVTGRSIDHGECLCLSTSHAINNERIFTV